MKRTVALFLACWLGLVMLTFVSSWQARLDLVESQRNGCERGKLDRSANALGWRNAERARRAAGEHDVADVYARIASGLEARSQINCMSAFPAPPLITLD